MKRMDLRVGVISDHLGVNATAAAILLLLYDAGGEPLSIVELARAAPTTPVSVRVRVSELRSILEAEAIDTVGGGYALTPIGLLETRRALNEAATALLVLPSRARVCEGLAAVQA